jgi:hypothetical protein
MRQALPTIERVFSQSADPGLSVEYTSGKEWFHHAMWSLHHSGNAVDVRTRTLSDHGIGALSAHIETSNMVAKQAVRHADVAADALWTDELNPVTRGAGSNLTAHMKAIV